MIRLLHTADLHLDWAFTQLPANRRPLRRREAIGIFYQLVSLAIERKVQGVIIAGDILQSQIPPQEQRSALAAGFTRLADQGIPVFICPGHDESRLGILERLEMPGNVCLLGGEAANSSNLIPGLTIYGLPTMQAQDFRPLHNFIRHDRPGLHLAVAHGTLQGLPSTTPDDSWLPILPEDIARSGLDYLALGHYHEHYACNHGGTHAVYSGSPARLDFNQGTLRTAVLVTLSEGPPSIERLNLRDRPYLDLHYDLSKILFADAVTEVEQRADPEACARVVLSGAISEEIDFFADRFLERCGSSFFFLDVVDETEIALTAGSSDTVQDLFVRRFKAALAETDLSPEERATEEYAFRAGLIALKGGQI